MESARNKKQLTTTDATSPQTGIASLNVQSFGSVGIQLAGTWVATVTFEASIDGETYTTLNMLPITGTQTAVTTSAANGIWAANVAGLAFVRARCSAFTSGWIGVTMVAAPASGR